MPTDFQSLRHLDIDELRDVLATGAPEERVWAAWAIALRSGAMPDIVEHVADEPSPGVRRALLPVLVGHGEVDILVALARHDPSIEVRRDASVYATRLAAQAAIPPALVVELYSAAPSAIRCAIIGAMPGTATAELLALIETGSRSDDTDVVVEAFDAALRTHDHALCERMMAWLRVRPLAQRREPWLRLLGDRDRLAALTRWLDDDLRDSAFEATDIPLSALAPLIRDHDPQAYDSIRRHRGLRDLPLGLLFDAIEVTASLDFLRELHAQLRERTWLPSELLTRASALMDELDRRIHVLTTTPHEQPRHDIEHTVRLLGQLRQHLHRLTEEDDDDLEDTDDNDWR